tara:strand:- start:1437 stop:1904 length:468 start_codon:yes stop_codon:yes gene_type:complete
MANHQADFQTRYNNPIAEPKSEEFYRKKGYTYFRYGIDQGGLISAKEFNSIPIWIQKTPDYILVDKIPRSYFVEVKGCHQVLRMKVKDFDCYGFWNNIIPNMNLIFFIYSTSLQSSKQISYSALDNLISHGGYKINKYPENNKEYWEIAVEDIWG